VLVHWDRIKSQEKAGKPAPARKLKELPARLPALLFAAELVKQIKKAGLELPASANGHASIPAAELDEKAAGKMLFEIAAACRAAKIDPESALRRYAQSVADQIEHAP
jgi:XTP/dITP diphosphohydrolase/tetrapyrrole methylase family protein/MazG family protein